MCMHGVWLQYSNSTLRKLYIYTRHIHKPLHIYLVLDSSARSAIEINVVLGYSVCNVTSSLFMNTTWPKGMGELWKKILNKSYCSYNSFFVGLHIYVELISLFFNLPSVRKMKQIKNIADALLLMA